MAMPRSLAPLLLVLSISFVFTTTAHATQSSIAAAGGDSLKKACFVTTFKHLGKEGEPLILESQSEVAGSKDEAIKGCLAVLVGNLENYVKPLPKFTPEQSEARDVLNDMLSVPSNSGATSTCLENAIVSAMPIVRKMFKYEEMLQVKLDLMEDAQPASLPPPEPEVMKGSGAVGKME